MPGGKGRYVIEEIRDWRDATFRRKPENDRKNWGIDCDNQEILTAHERLIQAQARKETANANIAQRRDAIQEGGMALIEDVNIWASQFLTETRTVLTAIPATMFAGVTNEQDRQMVIAIAD